MPSLPAIVVGHSGGGGSAIGLALADHSRVRALILLAPGLRDYPWPAGDPFFVQFSELRAAGDQDGVEALGLRTWASGDDDPVVRAQIRSATTAFFTSGTRERPDPPAFERLDQIAMPSSLLIGGHDHPMLVRCAQTIAGRIPGCRLVTVPEADHMLPLRAPDLIVDLIAGHAPTGRDRR